MTYQPDPDEPGYCLNCGWHEDDHTVITHECPEEEDEDEE